jgi:hypothetical protein
MTRWLGEVVGACTDDGLHGAVIRNALGFLTRVLCPRSHPGVRWRGGDYTRRVRIPDWNEGSQWKRSLRSTLISVDFYSDSH